MNWTSVPQGAPWRNIQTTSYNL